MWSYLDTHKIHVRTKCEKSFVMKSRKVQKPRGAGLNPNSHLKDLWYLQKVLRDPTEVQIPGA